MSRFVVVVVAALAGALLGASPAVADRIVYRCGEDLCAVQPDSGVTTKLTSDGASMAYRYPSITRDGRTVAAARSNDVMAGAYGTNLTTRVAGTRDMNAVAIAPDGSGVAESHSYVATRFGCPLTGGCLELVDESDTFFVPGGTSERRRFPGGGGVGFLGPNTLISSFYTLDDRLHKVCVTAPGANGECAIRFTSPTALTGLSGSPDGRLVSAAVAVGADQGARVTVFDAATGAPVRDLGPGSSTSFAPDGRRLAFATPDGWIATVPVTGGAVKRLVQGQTPAWGGGVGPGPEVASKALRLRSRRVPVQVRCGGPATCRGTVRLAKGSRTLGRRGYRIAAGRSVSVAVTPTASGRRTIARSRAQRVTVQLRPSSGKPFSSAMTLRR